MLDDALPSSSKSESSSRYIESDKNHPQRSQAKSDFSNGFTNFDYNNHEVDENGKFSGFKIKGKERRKSID